MTVSVLLKQSSTSEKFNCTIKLVTVYAASFKHLVSNLFRQFGTGRVYLEKLGEDLQHPLIVNMAKLLYMVVLTTLQQELQLQLIVTRLQKS